MNFFQYHFQHPTLMCLSQRDIYILNLKPFQSKCGNEGIILESSKFIRDNFFISQNYSADITSKKGFFHSDATLFYIKLSFKFPLIHLRHLLSIGTQIISKQEFKTGLRSKLALIEKNICYLVKCKRQSLILKINWK